MPRGRIKGSRNKVPEDIKRMIEQALHGVGGRHYLMRQAEANPAAFLALLGKVLPRDLNVNSTGELRLTMFLSSDPQARTEAIDVTPSPIKVALEASDTPNPVAIRQG